MHGTGDFARHFRPVSWARHSVEGAYELRCAQQNSKNTGNLMTRPLILLLSTAMLTLAGTAQSAQPKATPMPDITIYHLEGRRSERIVWLMEELGMPYKLEFKRGDLAGSMAAIKAINPGMPVAPTVKY